LNEVDHSKRFTIGFAATDLCRPFAYFEPSLWHSIKVDLDWALAMTRQEVSLVDQVEKALTNLLLEGRSLLGDVAARLGIGPRTLQRHLQAQGVHYAALRDQARLMLVKTYLSEQRLQKEEIAHLAGFCDPNSFFRRYRRWCETGQIDQKTDKLMDNL
jgi:AraC-like DNA-binding protein